MKAVSAVQITFVDPDGKEISTSSSSGILRNLALENNVEIYEGFNDMCTGMWTGEPETWQTTAHTGLPKASAPLELAKFR